MADKKEIKLEDGVVGTIDGDTIKFSNEAYNKFGEARGIPDLMKTQRALVEIYGEACAKITPTCADIICESGGKVDNVHVDFGQSTGSLDYDYAAQRKNQNPQTHEPVVHFGVGKMSLNMPAPSQLSKDNPIFAEQTERIKKYFNTLK